MTAQTTQGMRLIPNGVFVVAASHEGKTHGFTATWVSQASYRNPLLTVAIDKGHDTYGLIKASGSLVLNLLGAAQSAVAEHFGHQRREPGVSYFREEDGRQLPVLKECVATISCRVIGTMDARDHDVLLVEATESQVLSDEDPLVYVNKRGYCSIKPA